MEIKRVTSDNAFSFYNLLCELVHIYIKCLLSYYLISYAKSYYQKSLKKIKEMNILQFFLEILAAIFTLFYSSIIVYAFSLNNFYKIKVYIFSIWINLYRTDSNLREYDSFKLFYCQENYYNNLSYQNTGNYEISRQLNSLCYGSGSLDILYLESLLIILLTLPNFCYLLFVSFPRREEEDSFKNILDGLVDVLLKIFYSLLFFYFLHLYYSTYMNYNSIIKENMKQDSSHNLNELKLDEDESSSITFFDIVKIIIEFILEIAG